MNPSEEAHIRDQLDLDEETVHTNATVADDGRMDIKITQKSDDLPPWLAQALQSEASTNDEAAEAAPSYHPALNIVIQIIGSRGDVQPFVALGQVLRYRGHRVRIATHPMFRQFVLENGLEFYSIGGDPAKLMAFMVKNPGLIPGLEAIRGGEISSRRREMATIIEGCWHSCIDAGEGMDSDLINRPSANFQHGQDVDDTKASEGKPFIADAIIANPPSLAHIHCAEKLGVPLHLMFTMPWSPTKAFPHPLANVQSSNAEANLTNFMSYALVETMMWQGLSDLVNRFRKQTLNLDPIDAASAPGMVTKLKIPYTYCWSPALIPKPSDWGRHISISGFFFLPLSSTYIPPPELADFLAGSGSIVYIGFGSIVVDDPNALTALIFKAVQIAGVRAVVSKGWGDLGDKGVPVPENIYMLGNCPHDWLFPKIACVVHHGGAGTTAAGIAAGKPTAIVPFFGDQPFWGDMIARAGAGPKPIPFKKLDSNNLAIAITEALKPETTERAHGLGQRIEHEQGAENGADYFHRLLPIREMCCSLAPTRAASWRVGKTDIRLSALAAVVLMKEGLLDLDELRLQGYPALGFTRDLMLTMIRNKSCEYAIKQASIEPLTSGALAATGTLSELVGGFGDLSRGVYHRAKTDSKAKKADALTDEISPSSTTSGPYGDQVEGMQTSDQVEHASTIRDSSSSESSQGLKRIAGAGLKAPMDLSLAFAQGLRNAPGMYGDKPTREQEKVTGIQSGLKVAGKELGYGVYDGFSGLVTHPMNGQKEEGRKGLLKGIGKGLAGAVLKPLSGVSGVFGYTLKGIHREVQKKYGSTLQSHLATARLVQGHEEWNSATKEEHTKILESWRAAAISLAGRK